MHVYGANCNRYSRKLVHFFLDSSLLCNSADVNEIKLTIWNAKCTRTAETFVISLAKANHSTAQPRRRQTNGWTIFGTTHFGREADEKRCNTMTLKQRGQAEQASGQVQCGYGCTAHLHADLAELHNFQVCLVPSNPPAKVAGWSGCKCIASLTCSE